MYSPCPYRFRSISSTPPKTCVSGLSTLAQDKQSSDKLKTSLFMLGEDA